MWQSNSTVFKVKVLYMYRTCTTCTALYLHNRSFTYWQISLQYVHAKIFQLVALIIVHIYNKCDLNFWSYNSKPKFPFTTCGYTWHPNVLNQVIPSCFLISPEILLNTLIILRKWSVMNSWTLPLISRYLYHFTGLVSVFIRTSEPEKL